MSTLAKLRLTVIDCKGRGWTEEHELDHEQVFDAPIQLDLGLNALEQCRVPSLSANPELRLHLSILFLTGNKLSSVPDVSMCPHLRIIGLANNRIVSWSAGALPTSTEWIMLTNNSLVTLPADVSSLCNLRKLAVSGNRLCSLGALRAPDGTSPLAKLELVRFAGNSLNTTEACNVLRSLPGLSWVGISGQDAEKVPSTTDSGLRALTADEYTEYRLGRCLGSGASGAVYELDSHPHFVAKVYKLQARGADGAPENEIRIQSRVNHSNITRAFAVYGDSVLILERVDSDFAILSSVPSFDSVSRDAAVLLRPASLEHALQVAVQIAEAVAYLHSIHICHGDVYGHNILVQYGVADRTSTRAILHDFGAAFEYEPDQRDLYETCDARAVLIVAEELLQSLTEGNDTNSDVRRSVLSSIAELRTQAVIASDSIKECLNGALVSLSQGAY
jgi:tRNA A-37 threonylcarbamoyl transferase component Bud32